MSVLIGSSLVAAYIAGVAALFAPCCITVLLPSYLGSIFRERRKVFIMTFIFFLGIFAVFLPLGIGSAAFGQLLSRYHNAIFIGGSILLFALGAMLLLGVHYSLPVHVNPTLKSHHPLSVFSLGIFSGFATTCCAPVLAGVLSLSALPGSLFWGMMYTLSYVLGMVSPLFLIASFLDRKAMTEKLMAVRKTISYSLGSRTVRLSVGELVSGLMFILMAVLTMDLAFSNQLTVHSSYQVDINIWLTRVFQSMRNTTQLLPEYGWAGIAAVVFIGLIIRAVYLLHKEAYEPTDNPK